MPKQRGEQARDKTLSKLMKEVAVMQELQVRGCGGRLGLGVRGGGWVGTGVVHWC